ncbi:MAG: hypothetical protein ACOH2E_04970 [Candidatus Paracaedibacter sp.]
MKKILLSALASVALSCGVPSEASAHAAHQDEHGSKHHMHHEKKHSAKTGDEMAKECEERLEKIKDSGASLSPKMKAKFEYNLKKASVEIDALKNPDMDEHNRHADMCHRDLKTAEQLVKKHEQQLAHEKKIEEKKAKAAERKARAEENKAKAAERKAKRDEERKARKAAHDAGKIASHQDSNQSLDHGKSDGADKATPGSAAEAPIAEEKI